MTWKIEDGGNIHHNLAMSSDAPLVTQDELLRRNFPSRIVFVVQLMFYYKEHHKLSDVIAAIEEGYKGNPKDIVYTFCLNGKKEKEKKKK